MNWFRDLSQLGWLEASAFGIDTEDNNYVPPKDIDLSHFENKMIDEIKQIKGY